MYACIDHAMMTLHIGCLYLHFPVPNGVVLPYILSCIPTSLTMMMTTTTTTTTTTMMMMEYKNVNYYNYLLKNTCHCSRVIVMHHSRDG